MTTIDKYLSLKGLSYDSFQKNDIDKSKLLFDMISQGFIDSYVKKIFGLITSRLIKEKKENKNLHDFYWQKQEEFKYIIDNEMNKISDFYDEIKKIIPSDTKIIEKNEKIIIELTNKIKELNENNETYLEEKKKIINKELDDLKKKMNDYSHEIDQLKEFKMKYNNLKLNYDKELETKKNTI